MSIQGDVFEVFHKAPNVNVSLADLEHDLAYEARQIQQAVLQLAKKDIGGSITIVVAGSVWRYTPFANTNEQTKMYKHLATTQAGVTLVEDEDGQVYKLVEI